MLINIAGASYGFFNETKARELFLRSGLHMSSPRRRPFSKGIPAEADREVRDQRFVPGITPSFAIPDIEFLISVRPSWLPFRIGNRVIFEAYYPHRFAHQFGYDQVVPGPGLVRSSLYPDLVTASRCWFSLLRAGTGSSFVIPRAGRSSTFSAAYYNWFRAALGAYRSRIPQILSARARGRDNSHGDPLPRVTASDLKKCSGLDADIDYVVSSTRLRTHDNGASEADDFFDAVRLGEEVVMSEPWDCIFGEYGLSFMTPSGYADTPNVPSSELARRNIDPIIEIPLTQVTFSRASTPVASKDSFPLEESSSAVGSDSPGDSRLPSPPLSEMRAHGIDPDDYDDMVSPIREMMIQDKLKRKKNALIEHSVLPSQKKTRTTPRVTSSVVEAVNAPEHPFLPAVSHPVLVKGAASNLQEGVGGALDSSDDSSFDGDPFVIVPRGTSTGSIPFLAIEPEHDSEVSKVVESGQHGKEDGSVK